jgi:hypothetical protein
MARLGGKTQERSVDFKVEFKKGLAPFRKKGGEKGCDSPPWAENGYWVQRSVSEQRRMAGFQNPKAER